jgi:hypothetical protein
MHPRLECVVHRKLKSFAATMSRNNNLILVVSACLLTVAMACGCGHSTSANAPSPPQSPSGKMAIAKEAMDSSADASPSPQATAHSASQGNSAETSASPAGIAAAQPAQSSGQRPPADRQPVRPGEAEKITFEDLLLVEGVGLQADVVFRPFMLTERVKELDGKRVSLSGYMYGGVASARGIKEFILLRQKECKFGPGGQADHLAQVALQKGTTIDFTTAPVKVEATLKVEPFEGPDGNTWSIYRLEDAQLR